MRVENIHQRVLPVPAGRAAFLLDGLASARDRLWPAGAWPPMRLDRPLGVGADGGHGPIRYVVEAYEPGRTVRFRFTGPAGFDGYHAFEILPDGPDRCILRHTVRMAARGEARVTWPLAYRPLHDALIEDALARAEAALGLVPRVVPWSWRVRLLRRLAAGGRARPQPRPDPEP